MPNKFFLDEFRKWFQISKKWSNFLPPFRPSTNDLRIFADVIRTNFVGRVPNTMVLGSTPEFRDLLYELGVSVTVVDETPEMIREMARLRVYNSQETTIVDDWFNFLPVHKQSYDVILSDLTQGNIPFSKHSEFYRLVSEALTSDGLFIDRVFIFKDHSLLYTADEEFRRYAEIPAINLVTLNEMFFKCFVASDLVFESGQANFHEIYSFMREKYDSPVLHKYAELMEEYLAPDGSIWYYGKYWNEMSLLYFQGLGLVSEFASPEPLYKNIPHILVSKPK